MKFETLQTLLKHFGFQERQPRGGSSHYTFILNDMIITIPKDKPVIKIYVKHFLKLIDQIDND